MSIDVIKIREIEPSDNEALGQLIREVLIEIGMPKVGTAYADSSLDFMFETYQKQRSIYFVLEENGLILGGGGVAPLDNYDGNVCELQKMYFKPSLRGKGYGKKLLQTCLDSAERLHFEKIYLETQPYMDKARKLYEKFGFRYLDKPMGDTGHHSCQTWMLKEL